MRYVVYLGVKFTVDGKMEGKLDRRVGIALRTVGPMEEIVLGNKGIS